MNKTMVNTLTVVGFVVLTVVVVGFAAFLTATWEDATHDNYRVPPPRPPVNIETNASHWNGVQHIKLSRMVIHGRVNPRPRPAPTVVVDNDDNHPSPITHHPLHAVRLGGHIARVPNPRFHDGDAWKYKGSAVVH